MMASAEGKADVKKALYIFLIGCVVVYGSFGIWKLMIDILKTV